MQNRLGRADEAVQSTNDDAQISKLSCVQFGYMSDAYVKYFVRRAVKRSPLINRGYYARVAALRHLLHSFLAGGSSARQVLVLGAGYDTSWFQLQSQGQAPYRYIEVDFNEVMRKKIAIIQQHDQLRSLVEQSRNAAADAPSHSPGVSISGGDSLPPAHPADQAPAREASPSRQLHPTAPGNEAQPPQQLRLPPPPLFSSSSSPTRRGGNGSPSAATELITPRYSLVAADLRDLVALQQALQRAQLDPSLPTLVLCECVLVYLEPADSAGLIAWLGQLLPTAACVVYEQIRPDDAFGRQMVENLEARGCPLRGVAATPSLEAQRQRFLAGSWDAAEAWDMDQIYTGCLESRDRARVERLEMFDEFEEWHMMQQHYCIAIGYKDSSGELSRTIRFTPHTLAAGAIDSGLLPNAC